MKAPSSNPQQGRLLRAIGPWGLAAIAFNFNVGAGVFAMPESVAERVGTFAPLLVLVVGLSLLPVVLGLAKLARLFDATGGPILYVHEAFGATAGFQVGWISSLSSMAGVAANLNLLADYALGVSPGPHSVALHTISVIAALLLVFAINLGSASFNSGALQWISLAKLLPLVWLAVASVPAIVSAGTGARPAVQPSITEAVLLSIYAFMGFEGTLTVAGEARRPRRDLPRMVVVVFLAVGLLYTALSWGYVALIYDPAHVQKAPLAQMGKALAGVWGLRLVIATVAVSIFGGALANGMGLSRRLVALEEGGNLPLWFGRIGSRGVPRNAVLFVFAVLAVLALSGGFTALAILAVTSRVLIYLSCLIALPVIRRRREGPMFETSDALVLPAIPVCVFLLSRSTAWLPVAAAVLAGFLVLFIARRLRSRQLTRSEAA